MRLGGGVAVELLDDLRPATLSREQRDFDIVTRSPRGRELALVKIAPRSFGGRGANSRRCCSAQGAHPL